MTLIVYRSGLRGAGSVWSGGRQVAEGEPDNFVQHSGLKAGHTPVVM